MSSPSALTLWLIVGVLGAGTFLLYVSQHRQKKRIEQDAKRKTYKVTFPSSFRHEQALHWLRTLHELRKDKVFRPLESIVFESVGETSGISFYLHIPDYLIAKVDMQLRTHIPSSHLEPCEAFMADWKYGVEIALTNNHKPLTISSPEAGVATLLANLIHPDKPVMVQWVIAPAHHRPEKKTTKTKWPFPDPEHHKEKNADYPFLAVARIVAHDPRVLNRIIASLNSFSSHGVRFVRRPITNAEAIKRVNLRATLPHFPAILNTKELSVVTMIPFGEPNVPGLPRGRSRHLPPDPSTPSGPIVVANATYPGMARPLGLTAEDRTMHTLVLGKNGTGKTTAMERLALAEIQLGHGLAYIDPHGDSAQNLGTRIPRNRLNDVVYFDPIDTSHPIPLNVFGAGHSPESTADDIMAIIGGLFGSEGIYLANYLRSALQALASLPGMTLVDVVTFLEDEVFRAQTVARLPDQYLRNEWIKFDRKTPKERNQVILPALHRIKPLLTRETVRLTIGQQGHLDIARIIREGKILIARLPGSLGEDTASLFGAFLVSQIWQAAQARPQPRKLFSIYVDEVHKFLHMPVSIDTVLAEARKYGTPLTLATQHESKLDVLTRHAVHANTRTKIVFECSVDDAPGVARELGGGLTPADLMGLARYEVVLKTPHAAPVTGRTLPLPEPTLSLEAVIAASRARWGTSRDRWGRPRNEIVPDTDQGPNDAPEDDKDDGIGSE